MPAAGAVNGVDAGVLWLDGGDVDSCRECLECLVSELRAVAATAWSASEIRTISCVGLESIYTFTDSLVWDMNRIEVVSLN